MKTIHARLDKLEGSLGDQQDDIPLVYIPTGDEAKDAALRKRLEEISTRTGLPYISMEIKASRGK